MKNSFRQVCDKPCASHPVLRAEWSPLRDLIAVLTANGEVRLHRMHWQRVWTIPGKDRKATCLSWHPYGKLIAVGYDNGEMILVEIEKAKVIHTAQFTDKITTLNWSTGDKNIEKYKECITPYLPEFQKEEVLAAIHKLDLLSTSSFITLTVATSKGVTHLYMNGMFLVLRLTREHFPGNNKTYEIVQSHLDISKGIVTLLCKGSEDRKYFLFQFTSELLARHGEELLFLSKKYLACSWVNKLSDACMKNLQDTAEDVNLKINSKLKSFDSLLEGLDSSIACEFTTAYAAGVSSPELQTFLTQHLTTKGLAQLAQNVRTCYTSLSSDTRDELALYLQHLVSHFTELNGIAQWREKFGVLGLDNKTTRECYTLLVQAMMKVKELLAVIQSDMKYLDVFFTWLTELICKVSGETNTISDIQWSNEEYDTILDFLEFRLNKYENENGEKVYIVERVSQFFQAEPIVDINSSVGNEWLTFVQASEVLRKSEFIIQPDEQASLLSLYERYKLRFQIVFESISTSLSNSSVLTLSTCLYQEANDHKRECESLFQFYTREQSLLLNIVACTCDSDRSFLLQIEPTSADISCYGYMLQHGNEMDGDVSITSEDDRENIRYTLRDMKFYNSELITILFEEDNMKENKVQTIIAQLPISDLLLSKSIMVNCDLETGTLDKGLDLRWTDALAKVSELRRIELFRGRYLSVNGHTRQTSLLISQSGRRVRVFDMNGEEDAEDNTEDSKLNETSLQADGTGVDNTIDEN